MSEQEYYDKEQEKEQEKEEEKQREKGEEKSWDEKWRRDPVSTAGWAAFFIWAGLVLLFANLGLLAELGLPTETMPLILIGAGVILCLEVLFRLAVPEHRRPVIGTLIFAFILLGAGLGRLMDAGMEIIAAAVLIAAGLAVLLRGFFRRS